MPAKTKRQQRYMGMCAHKTPKPKGCPSKKVSRKFARKPKVGYK